MTGADRERRRDEFADDGAERDITVRYVESRLRLVQSAAARAWEHGKDQGRNHETGQRRRKKSPLNSRGYGRSEQKQVGPFHRNTEADHRHARKDSNKNRENEKKAFFVIRQLRAQAP